MWPSNISFFISRIRAEAIIMSQGFMKIKLENTLNIVIGTELNYPSVDFIYCPNQVMSIIIE